MPDTENRRFLLVKRPMGMPARDDFQLVREAVPRAPEGGMVVRNRFISLDPAQRGWMDDAPSYMPPIALGDPVRATTVGVVEESRNPDFSVGDWVLGLNAIEDFSVVLPGGFTSRIDVGIVDRPSRYLSAVGAVGLTAYFGLLDAGQPKAGETLLVTGAAGAVGSMVGQIGRIMGMRVIGIAGGAEKCRRLVQDYGFDAAIDYKGKTQAQIATEIAGAAPQGIDILFENVGGAVMDAAMLNLALHARVVLCGLISEYNTPEKAGMRNLWQVIVRQATIKGFLIAAYVPRFAEGGAQIVQWIADGRLRVDEDIRFGLDNAYEAFMRLFTGTNTGKLVLEVD